MLFRALKEVCYFYSYYLLNFVDQEGHSVLNVYRLKFLKETALLLLS